MIYSPKKEKKAANLAFLCICTCFVLMLLSTFLAYGYIFQLAAFAAVIAGIFLLQRYVLCEYRYLIDDREDGSSDLIVCKKQGKNDFKVCHISLLNVESVRRFDKSGDKPDTRYFYEQNLTDKRFEIVTNEGGKRVGIVIEASDAFLAALESRIGGGGGRDGFMM